MSKKDGNGCLGCLGSLVVLTFFGYMIFGGGVWLKIGGLRIALTGDSLDRLSTTITNLTELENSKKVAEDSSQKFRLQIEQGQFDILPGVNARGF